MLKLKKFSRLLPIVLSTTLLSAPILSSANTDIELSGMYRLESNDCPGCGYVDIQSEVDLANALADARSEAIANKSRHEQTAESFNNRFQNFFANLLARLGIQVVYLNFDAGGDPTFPVCVIDGETGEPTGDLVGIFNDHVFTPEERAQIQANIENDFSQFKFIFTQNEPSFGEFTTINFGQNDAPADCSQGSNISLTTTGGISVLFGRADEIDFGNRNKSSAAFTDASIWEFLSQLGDGSNFARLANLDVDADFGGDLTAAISFATINQSANTGAHELGHTLGLRHQNSFGAPGDGLPNTGAVTPIDFVPIFEGPMEADETVLHTMASGASVGLTFDGGVNTDRFFSERSATRLAVNEIAARSRSLIVNESDLEWRGNRFWLRNIYVPNTIIEGKNADSFLKVRSRIIDGNIEEFGETDSYFFRGRKGEFFNAELVPIFAKDQTFEEGILGQVRVFQQHNDGTETLVGINIRSFESLFDTEIFDVELPANALYRVEVAVPDEVYIQDFDGDGIIDPIPLSAAGAPELLTGNYELFMFTCDKKILPKGLAAKLRKLRQRHWSRLGQLIN